MAGPRSRVSRVLLTGPLAPFADTYRAELLERGYAPLSVVNELRQVKRFSRWLDAGGLWRCITLSTPRRSSGCSRSRTNEPNATSSPTSPSQRSTRSWRPAIRAPGPADATTRFSAQVSMLPLCLVVVVDGAWTHRRCRRSREFLSSDCGHSPPWAGSMLGPGRGMGAIRFWFPPLLRSSFAAWTIRN